MKREIWTRLALGALYGVGVWFLLYSGGEPAGALVEACGTVGRARAAQVTAFAGFGLCAGLISLLWKRETMSFLKKSLISFLIVGTGMALWTWTLHGWDWQHQEGVNLWIGGTLILFVMDWARRFYGCRRDVDSIREKLKLTPPPSVLRWRETMPDMVLIAAVELVLPPLLRLVDARDFPVLTGLLYPYLVLPVVCFSSALSLGKRWGITPLYPVVCAVLTIPHIFWLYNSSALFQAGVAGAAALLGNLVGAAVRAYRKRNSA